jgi:RNA polymerase sigma factor (sigma-70 family)
MHDAELLQRFVREDSEAAFAELVKRHVDLVFSAARRLLGDATLAEEVTQSVFCLLARKAPGLTGCVSLSGWLYRSTVNLAAQALRTELRRRRHEQEAALMNTYESPGEELWTQLAPHLDAAMRQLGETDRHAVLLRYFERKPMRDVGEALGVSEAAAKMRVGRAVERLRTMLAKRGVACSAVALTTVLTEQAATAAPVALTSSILAAVGSITIGSTFVGSLPTLLTFMAKLNLKTVGLTAAVLALIGGGIALQQYRSGSDTAHLAMAGGLGKPNQDNNTAFISESNTNMAFRPTESANLSALEIAKANLRTALSMPRPTDGRAWIYPSDAVSKAILAFGADRRESFAVLVDVFASSDEEARRQALSVMGRVGRPEGPNAPGAPAEGARPFLKTILLGDDLYSHLALTALDPIGFTPDDMVDLATLLARTENAQLKRYIPETISKAISGDPERFQPYLTDVRNLLESPDPSLRLQAACALAQSDAAKNPQILTELDAGLKSSDALSPLMALETLGRLGPTARPLLQDVVDYSKRNESIYSEVALNTLAKIDASLPAEMPEVADQLKKSELRANAFKKELVNNWTHLDVRLILADSALLPSLLNGSTDHAQLMDLVSAFGDSAKDLLPNLKSAMAGLTETQRSELLKVIVSVDPTAAIRRFESGPVINAASIAMQSVYIPIDTGLPPKEVTKWVDGHPIAVTVTPSQADQRVIRILQGLAMSTASWRSEEEIRDAATKLAEVDPKTYALFVKTAIERDASLKSVLQPEPSK